MRLFDRLFKRPLSPSVETALAREQPGPMTAREAWVLAVDEALALDPRARLILVSSGTDIRPDGRSRSWEFLFELEQRQARVLLSYAPDSHTPDIDIAPVMLTRRVTRETGRLDASLPFEFRDSPEVVDALGRAGVDFISGPTDLKIEGRLASGGVPVWSALAWGKEYHVPFAASAD